MSPWIAFATNFKRLKNYKLDKWGIEEVIFYEFLLVKAISFRNKKFTYIKANIYSELGIKRTRIEKAIFRLEQLGIISVKNEKINNPKYPRHTNVTEFTIYPEAIMVNMDEIYTPTAARPTAKLIQHTFGMLNQL